MDHTIAEYSSQPCLTKKAGKNTGKLYPSNTQASSPFGKVENLQSKVNGYLARKLQAWVSLCQDQKQKAFLDLELVFTLCLGRETNS